MLRHFPLLALHQYSKALDIEAFQTSDFRLGMLSLYLESDLINIPSTSVGCKFHGEDMRAGSLPLLVSWFISVLLPSLMQSEMWPNPVFLIVSLSSTQIGGMSAIPAQGWSQHTVYLREEGVSFTFAVHTCCLQPAKTAAP